MTPALRRVLFGGRPVRGAGVTPAVFRAAHGFNNLGATQTWNIVATGASAGDGLFLYCLLYHTDSVPVFLFTSGGTATLQDSTTWTTSGDGTITAVALAYTLTSADISAGVVAATVTQLTSSGNTEVVSVIYTGPTTLTKKNFANSAVGDTTLAITGYAPGGTSHGALAFIGQRINGGSATATTPPSGWTMRSNNFTGTPPGAGAVFFNTASDNLTTASSTSYTWSTWATTGYETVAGSIFDMT